MLPSERLEPRPSRDPLDPDELLAHVDWVRGLARGLVLDAGRADDLAQEACVVALTRPPSDRRNLRGWMGRVLRNLVYQEARGQRRRAARERAVARPEHELEGDEPSEAERRTRCRRLVELVTELEEPFRHTVLQRYFEDLHPLEIAAREGIPEATVRSRLRRGLERLRTRLDRRHAGDRAAWIAALAGLQPAPPATAAGPLGIALPRLLIGLGLTAVVAVGLDRSLRGPAAGPPSATTAEAAADLELLRRDVGTWDCVWESLDEHGNLGAEAHGTETYRFVSSGVLEVTTEIPSRATSARGFELHDPQRGTLVLVDVASDGEGWIFVRERATGQFVSLPRRLPDGSTRTLRFTVLLDEPDAREILLESTTDGATWRPESVQRMRRRR